jgi:hypothetical protein
LEAAKDAAGQAGATPSQDLNAAGEAMRRAEGALQHGDFAGAEAAQNTALDRLRAGAEALAAEMHQRGERSDQPGDEGEGGRDPLGRASGGDSGNGTRVPTQMDPVRAREIFDEIRRRAQDPNRPETEREYLRRLMDRFGES